MDTLEKRLEHINEVKRIGQDIIDNADAITSVIAGYEIHDEDDNYSKSIFMWHGGYNNAIGLATRMQSDLIKNGELV